jgi:MFS family permease
LAVTYTLLLSTLIITYLPEIHRSWGIALITTVGALLSVGGPLAWSEAWQPWQIFAAAAMTGAGWAVTSGAALNTMIAPWFDCERPRALSLAFNGASVGGIVFVPLWIALIAQFGFLPAAILIGSSMLIITPALAYRFLRQGASHYGPFCSDLLIRNRVVAVAGGSHGGSERTLSETRMPAASRSRTRTPIDIGNTGGQPEQISAPSIALAAAGCVKRIWIMVATFYQRVRDRDHLADLEWGARNDLRQDRVREEARKRFWQS